jgi:hypothetical protein
MTDLPERARKLATACYFDDDGTGKTSVKSLTALILAELQAVRERTIENCRKECYIDETSDGVWVHMQVDGYHCALNLSAYKGEMGYKFAARYHEAKLKEAAIADAE